MSDLQPVFSGEMQLMNWGESSANGAWVKFWITPEDLEAFRSLKCKSGKIAGHRVAAVLVEIGDDEQPVQQVEPEKPKGGELARMAGVLCQDVEFRVFMSAQGWHAGNDQEAAETIRQMCGVTTRAELDHNADAATVFHRVIRGPWVKWKAARGIK
ncbi:hypothetical protein [Paraburkholderia caffeinilytica]|uniref:hypothetical protein n=1 Tax=Paraburkholderia caffeinilytica TaxID=1761016 RepID=UPI0038BE12CA